jgi:hypothetical protein
MVDEGTSNGDTTLKRGEAVDGYQDFMFDPSYLTAEVIAELRAICERPAVASTGTRLRAATKDE